MSCSCESAGLGVLSTAALTAEALAARSLPLLGVVVGSWPLRARASPRPRTSTTSRGSPARRCGAGSRRVPGRLASAGFTAAAPGWFDIS